FPSMTPSRRVISALTRALLIAALAVLLAGASRVRETSELAVVAVVDVSGSVQRFGGLTTAEGRYIPAVDRARAMIERLSDGRGPDDMLGIVVFDGRATTIATPTRADPTGRP